MARPTKCVIDLPAFRENLNAVKNRVGNTKIMALVKADAYERTWLSSGCEAHSVP